MSPTCPHRMNASSLGHIDDQVNIGVIIVVGTPRNFDVLVCHPDILGIDLQIVGGSHHRKFDCALASKRLVAPLPNGSNFFHGGDTLMNASAQAHFHEY